MGELNFNTRQCIRALNKLGFTLANKRRGRHDKFMAPASITAGLQPGQPRFIMIPRHGDLHCQPEILRELKAMGGEGLVDSFKRFL